jgi:hypothetical protein
MRHGTEYLQQALFLCMQLFLRRAFLKEAANDVAQNPGSDDCPSKNRSTQLKYARPSFS